MRLIAFATLLTGASAAIDCNVTRDGQTSSDIVNVICRQMTLLYARGTNEGGNLGLAVGPPLQTALAAAVGTDNLAVQGIDYPADCKGAIGGSVDPFNATGSVNCADMVTAVLEYCPNTAVVISGYSQGAQQAHGCLMRLSPEQVANIQAVVTFGDPLSATPFDQVDAARTKVFCNEGDEVCNNKPIILPPHFTYGTVAIEPAVAFITNQSSPISVTRPAPHAVSKAQKGSDLRARATVSRWISAGLAMSRRSGP
ncbi:cutinase-domain-containing protein [Auriculariales sp. MPI-PUGE-AT-0066]|nr:cutinase-domain-containing protein [Auriculariales sp. MPI-PUGE-AT-0066]